MSMTITKFLVLSTVSPPDVKMFEIVISAPFTFVVMDDLAAP